MIDVLWPTREADVGDERLLDLYETGPGIRVNFVSSLDGAASRDGRSGGLGGPADRRVFALLRTLADVVLVGAGTVRAEGYRGELVDAESAAWRAAHGRTAHPGFAVVSARLDLDPAVLADSPVRPRVLTLASASPARRAALAEVADLVDVGESAIDVARLRAALGSARVLCEGGPRLFATLLAADAVDELCLTIAPTLEGGDAGRIAQGALPAPRPMTPSLVLLGDGELLLRSVRP